MSNEQDALAYYRQQMSSLVWSGFFTEQDLQYHLEDLSYDPDAKEHLDVLRDDALAQLKAKRDAEESWPLVTDWDKLDLVFEGLSKGGILCLHNAGYTTSDAHGDAWEIIKRAPAGRWRGFAYYHGQDVERAVGGDPLFLGYDAVAEGPAAKTGIAQEVREAVEAAGFQVEWNGDPERRMSITNLDWKKRTDWDAPGDQPSEPETQKPGFWQRLFGKG